MSMRSKQAHDMRNRSADQPRRQPRGALAYAVCACVALALSGPVQAADWSARFFGALSSQPVAAQGGRVAPQKPTPEGDGRSFLAPSRPDGSELPGLTDMFPGGDLGLDPDIWGGTSFGLMMSGRVATTAAQAKPTAAAETRFGLGVSIPLAPNVALQGGVLSGSDDHGRPSLTSENRQLSLTASFRF
ncbi:hypothetical protein TRIHO_42770 [Tritonibacter horizontis]|uniref:Uncharacterized protein n=2 Tax=Tritonibacter horizontis TaxID=1768241 RepID=A0A132BRA6_9RHOB|nr:hypothetical protein TRIHO_42770 [Tritonibacter horizontis]